MQKNSEKEHPKRESMNFDIVIVGAGPAGLSAAIWLKKNNPELSVVIVEKSAEVGGHILSGAVLDTSSLRILFPDFEKDKTFPFKTKVTFEELSFFTRHKSFKIPHFLLPKFIKNKNHLIISLANLCRWLAKKAEDLGVEIYPGFAATEFLLDDKKQVKGIATGDMGLSKKNTPTSQYSPGVELLGKYTLIAEGARGSLAKKIINYFHLAQNSDAQKYGLGFKEIWQIDQKNHKIGNILHSFGWPLDNQTNGGGFLYHIENNQVALGFIVHLDYKNPYLSLFKEFQRFKTHPKIKNILKGGKRIAYGARSITEGGLQSIPQITFPGGALLGCSAGYVNLIRLKGIQNAIYSGIAAAEEVLNAFKFSKENKTDPKSVLEIKKNKFQKLILKDLSLGHNFKPLWSKFGTKVGFFLAGFDLWWQAFFKKSLFGIMHHKIPDFLSLKIAKNSKKIHYPKPDQEITFDIQSSLFLANIFHEENQPCHLKVNSNSLQRNVELQCFDGPSQRYCPAHVYEWTKDQDGQDHYAIQAQNCLHCKCCDIKDPDQNITWNPPQGGEGPSYSNM